MACIASKWEVLGSILWFFTKSGDFLPAPAIRRGHAFFITPPTSHKFSIIRFERKVFEEGRRERKWRKNFGLPARVAARHLAGRRTQSQSLRFRSGLSASCKMVMVFYAPTCSDSDAFAHCGKTELSAYLMHATTKRCFSRFENLQLQAADSTSSHPSTESRARV
jgi:hypothetical protein